MFKVSAHMYCNMIDPEYEVPDDVVSFFFRYSSPYVNF
jgi:hypothetical protein